jgi:hypothetical protein
VDAMQDDASSTFEKKHNRHNGDRCVSDGTKPIHAN